MDSCCVPGGTGENVGCCHSELDNTFMFSSSYSMLAGLTPGGITPPAVRSRCTHSQVCLFRKKSTGTVLMEKPRTSQSSALLTQHASVHRAFLRLVLHHI